jgi:hypothetical protein
VTSEIFQPSSSARIVAPGAETVAEDKLIQARIKKEKAAEKARVKKRKRDK